MLSWAIKNRSIDNFHYFKELLCLYRLARRHYSRYYQERSHLLNRKRMNVPTIVTTAAATIASFSPRQSILVTTILTYWFLSVFQLHGFI